MEVPPPNSWRGAFSIASANASIEASSAIKAHGTTCTCMAGPVHCVMVTAIDAAEPERMACSRRGSRKAATYPRCCSTKRSWLTLPDASTAKHQLQIHRRLRLHRCTGADGNRKECQADLQGRTFRARQHRWAVRGRTGKQEAAAPARRDRPPWAQRHDALPAWPSFSRANEQHSSECRGLAHPYGHRTAAPCRKQCRRKNRALQDTRRSASSWSTSR